MRFVVKCSDRLADEMAARVRVERQAEREWWRARRAEQPEDLEPAQRAGWLARTWRPVPDGYRSRRARPWGTTDRRWPSQLTLDVPDDLGQVLVRGCHWTSAPHVAALQTWYGQHGEAHRGTHRGGRIWRGTGPSNADLEHRDRLQAAIITTGMVLRAAACRAVDLDPIGHV